MIWAWMYSDDDYYYGTCEECVEIALGATAAAAPCSTHCTPRISSPTPTTTMMRTIPTGKSSKLNAAQPVTFSKKGLRPKNGPATILRTNQLHQQNRGWSALPSSRDELLPGYRYNSFRAERMDALLRVEELSWTQIRGSMLRLRILKVTMTKHV